MRPALLHYDHWPDLDFSFTFDLSFVSEAIEFLQKIIGGVFNFVLRALRSGIGLFKVIWDKVFKRGLLKILELYGKLRGFLSRVLGPLLRWLRKIREWLDKHYWPMVKKQLEMLHRLRQIVGIFRAFNFKWAKALDERLARTEQRLIHNTRVIYAKLNELITLVSLASDPLAVLIANTRTRGLLNALNDFILGVTGKPLNQFLGLFLPGTRIPTDGIGFDTIRRDAAAAAQGEDNWIFGVKTQAEGLYDLTR